MLNTPIRFAGINSSWTDDYARKYRNMLFEMGYFAKLIDDPTLDEYGAQQKSQLVVYCYRPFNKNEVNEAIVQVFDSRPPID